MSHVRADDVHGDPEGVVGHCGGFDSVADHGNLVFPGTQVDHGLNLVFGQQVAAGLIEPQLPGDGVRDCLVVTESMIMWRRRGACP